MDLNSHNVSDREIESIEHRDDGVNSPTKHKSPSKKSKSKDVLISEGYLEILGSREPGPTISPMNDAELDDSQQLLIDKQTTLMKAMKAAADGNAEDASFLFRLHSRMTTSSTSVTQPNTTVREVVELPKKKDYIDLTIKDAHQPDELPFVENGITFMPGMRITKFSQTPLNVYTEIRVFDRSCTKHDYFNINTLLRQKYKGI